MTRNIGTAPSFPCKPTASVDFTAPCPTHGTPCRWTCSQTPSGPVSEAHCDCEEKR